jgi:hypothetical protein
MVNLLLWNCSEALNVEPPVHRKYDSHDADMSNYDSHDADMSKYDSHDADTSKYDSHDADMSNYVVIQEM